MRVVRPPPSAWTGRCSPARSHTRTGRSPYSSAASSWLSQSRPKGRLHPVDLRSPLAQLAKIRVDRQRTPDDPPDRLLQRELAAMAVEALVQPIAESGQVAAANPLNEVG